jgi:hypothetical protein
LKTRLLSNSNVPVRLSIALPALALAFFVLMSISLTACNPNRNSTSNGSIAPGDQQSPAPATAPAGGTTEGGAGDAGGGSNDRPTFDEIKAALYLDSEEDNDYGRFEFATSLLMDFHFLDSKDVSHKEMRFGGGLNDDIKSLLQKIRKDILVRHSQASEKLDFQFKETGGCDGPDGPQQASTKMCDTKAPICISLEYIQKMTPKASLKINMQALIMHELAHQHCADEKAAKQVERFFSSEIAQNHKLMVSIGDAFEDLRFRIEDIGESLSTGYQLCPQDGKKVVASDAYICQMLGNLNMIPWEIRKKIEGTSFKQVYGELPSQKMSSLIKEAAKFCDMNRPQSKKDREKMKEIISNTKSVYDSWAQDFSGKSGMHILDFSKYLFDHQKFSRECFN